MNNLKLSGLILLLLTALNASAGPREIYACLKEIVHRHDGVIVGRQGMRQLPALASAGLTGAKPFSIGRKVPKAQGYESTDAVGVFDSNLSNGAHSGPGLMVLTPKSVYCVPFPNAFRIGDSLFGKGDKWRGTIDLQFSPSEQPLTTRRFWFLVEGLRGGRSNVYSSFQNCNAADNCSFNDELVHTVAPRACVDPSAAHMSRLLAETKEQIRIFTAKLVEVSRGSAKTQKTQKRCAGKPEIRERSDDSEIPDKDACDIINLNQNSQMASDVITACLSLADEQDRVIMEQYLERNGRDGERHRPASALR